jgi:uncharacterized cupin superfamily protein
VPNVFEPNFDAGSEQSGFRSRRARLARQAGGEELGASLYELPPGQATFPYHYHLANEELLIVLSGPLELRTSEGWRTLEDGDVVSFPAGEEGAHQLLNEGTTPARFLLASEMRSPDLVVYPDSGKVGAREFAPGSERPSMRSNFRRAEAVDYWQGERPPEEER